MEDIEIQEGSEFNVTGVYGLTVQGIAFIDAWLPDPGENFTVVDSGKIIVPDDAVPALQAAAMEAGLEIVKTKAKV